MQTYLISLVLSLSLFAFGAEMSPPAPNVDEIRIVPVDPTPEPDWVETTIIFPEKGSVKTKQPTKVQIRLEGYPLGTDSDFSRAREVVNDRGGQSLRVVVDNLPPMSIYNSTIDTLDDDEQYFDQMTDVAIPYTLQRGVHTIRAFAVRSFGESLKGDGSFAVTQFYIETKKENGTQNLDYPFLTYNEPQGDIKLEGRKPILLDFYISNCQLSRDGYKVRITIDDKPQRNLTQWVPYYIYGLKKGTHTVRLELLDPANKLVAGPFNTVQKTVILR